MKKLFASTFAALALATPAQASDFAANFIAGRAVSICSVALGRMTVKQAAEWEFGSAMRDGLTRQQYLNFNDAADGGGWVHESVKDLIADAGGCEGLFGQAIPDGPSQQPPVAPAYFY